MRYVIAVLALVAVFSGCKKQNGRCENYSTWELRTGDIAAYASVDSEWLALSVYNPTSVNAIELRQQALKGDFEVTVDHVILELNDTLEPQFRLEVYNTDDEQILSGVALQHGEAYAYVDLNNKGSHVRIIDTNEGTLKLERHGRAVTCSFSVGDVDFSFTDSLDVQPVGVRLVLGSVEEGQGHIRALVDNFWAQDFTNHEPQTAGSEVEMDMFGYPCW